MDNPITTTPAVDPSHSTELLGKLDSLFSELQGLLGTQPDASAIDTGLATQANINEAGELENSVEYVAQKDGLKNELSAIQQREENRLSHVREQNVLISQRKEKVSGVGGYNRSDDDVTQAKAHKKSGPLLMPPEEDPLSEDSFSNNSFESTEDIDQLSASSSDFNDAFLGSSNTEKEEQRIRDQYESSDKEPANPIQLEDDEIIDIYSPEQAHKTFTTHLNMSLNPHEDVSITSNQEIEKRIQRIAPYIDKARKPVVGKAFAVPTTKSVARLRSKFGRM